MRINEDLGIWVSKSSRLHWGGKDASELLAAEWNKVIKWQRAAKAHGIILIHNEYWEHTQTEEIRKGVNSGDFQHRGKMKDLASSVSIFIANS